MNSNNNGTSLVNSGLNSDHPPQTPLTKIKVSPATQPIKKDKLQNTSKTTVNRELQKLTSLKGKFCFVLTTKKITNSNYSFALYLSNKQTHE